MIPKSQETIFFDDFTSGELDLSRWNVYITGQYFNDEQQAYVNSPETVYILPGKEIPGAENGVLVLHPRYRPGFVTADGKTFDFISGRINTREKMEFLYGSAAARIKLPAGPGLWPAFWALGSSKTWPDSGEIDIMEYIGETDWTSVALHGPGYSGETALVNKIYFPPGRDATDWHIYSVDWTPESLIFKVDGGLIYCATRLTVESHGPWALDNNKYLILNFALGGIYPFTVNGAQLPYYGMPKPATQLVKDDQARMMIDWVKLTRD